MRRNLIGILIAAVAVGKVAAGEFQRQLLFVAWAAHNAALEQGVRGAGVR